MNIQLNPYMSYGFPHLPTPPSTTSTTSNTSTSKNTMMNVLGGAGRLPFDLPSPKRFKQN